MNIKGSHFGIACRAAVFSFLAAGSASLLQAQQSPSPDSAPKAPLLMASSSSGLDAMASSSSSSSSESTVDAKGEFLFSAAAKDSAQPPPRRYGRPNYSDSHSNPDGSPKWAFMAGGGASLPVGNTKYYETPSYDVQGGFGRNFSKSLAVLFQFDYDRFGLQGATLANQTYVYNYCSPADVAAGFCTFAGSGGIPNITPGQLDGSNHVWSVTLNPTFTLATEGSMGAYFVVGGGFYHKVTDFTLPGTGTYCDPYYGCYQYQANQVIDHYTANAGGVNGGLGLTWKLSKFSNERLYIEGRYVVVLNQQKAGVNVHNVATSSATATNFYPANSNRTTYVPITVGLRF